MSNIKKTSCALGFFDGLHMGHAEVIGSAVRCAAELDLKPAVFTFGNSEKNTKLPKMKTGGNILSSEQKLLMLKDMGVETVYSPDFSEIKDLSPEEFISQVLEKRLSAAAVSCGYDFHFGKGGQGDALLLKKQCDEKGIIVNIIPAVNVNGIVVSSSAVRALIRSGDIMTANKMLGYELYYTLPVLYGKRIGNTLGAPTVNQQIPAGNVVPGYGVYKSRAVVKGKSYPAVTNIGLRPTVTGNAESEGMAALPLMETHIIGYDADDLYGEVIHVFLTRFIRAEKRFGGIEELKQQIKKDIDMSLNIGDSP